MAELAEIPLPGSYDAIHLCEMHKSIFGDIFAWAGEFRTINIEKPEQALAGLSVEYSEFGTIKSELASILAEMRMADWESLASEEKASLFSEHIARLWKIHPFREGNTRVVTHFYCQYYDSRNKQINRKLFENNAKYFRSALVAANAVFKELGDKSNKDYLYRIVYDAIGPGV
ncbi:MAG: Fic family protein [Clostridiales bacterium]|nr:Fic family protein [Clostridiales bacterium]